MSEPPPEPDTSAETDTQLTPDERAAIRAYLQRSEVRLSTIHRTATALLSGAGVLVLLPAVGRDSVVNVMSGLLSSANDPMHVALAALVVLTLALALIVIWLLLLELTRFYFHANHFTSARGTTFTPRFTLTSLHLPVDELGDVAGADLLRRRNDPANIELLVPANDAARRHIDAQVDAYDGLSTQAAPTDASRAAAMLQLAGVKDRTLVDEVAKVEYGMARHVLRVEVIVLRYIKALLVVLTTTLTTFVLAAVIESSPQVDLSAERWIAASLMLWAPAVLFVSSAPVRWLGQLLVAEGATTSGIRYDKSLTQLENVASVFSVVVLIGALTAGAVLLTEPASTIGYATFATVGLVGLGSELWLLRAIRR
ncbi:MAG: hypothetical protein R2696_10890 [Microthrixaceae bacterium]